MSYTPLYGIQDMHITPPLWQEFVAPPIYVSLLFSLGGVALWYQELESRSYERDSLGE